MTSEVRETSPLIINFHPKFTSYDWLTLKPKTLGVKSLFWPLESCGGWNNLWSYFHSRREEMTMYALQNNSLLKTTQAPRVVLVVENPPANAGDVTDAGLDPGVRKIPWRRKWKPAPVFLPEKSQGQRILTDYSPRGHKESNATEQLSTQHRKTTLSQPPKPVTTLPSQENGESR